MNDTNWQLKEGDQFESWRMLSLQIANAVKPRMVGGFIAAPDTQACYTASDHIEAQQQRIEALERELAEANKDAARYRFAIALEDNAEILYAAVLNNAPDHTAIGSELDAAIAASKGSQ